eukprot:gene12012-14193_t
MGTNIQTVFEQQQTVLKKLFGKATPTALSELIAEYDVQSKPTTEGRDCERVIDDLLWPTAIVNSIMVITFEAQVRIF